MRTTIIATFCGRWRSSPSAVFSSLIINPGEATDWIPGSARVVILDLSDRTYTVEPLG